MDFKHNINEAELKPTIEKFYLDYSVAVITDRALPDARDGLKPVHRRILYSANDLKIYSDASFRKSAVLVGQTMGSYHPHSNTAIYDAAVILAQPFATRYPLFEGQGNFGNIDGDGAAAYRYCLTGDTLVKMADGSLVPLKEIEQKPTEPGEFTELENVYVFNKDLKKVKATHFYNSGIQDTISVKTKYTDKPLVGTPNHPVITAFKEGSLLHFKWTTLDSIQVGDWLVSPCFYDEEYTGEDEQFLNKYTIDRVISIKDAGKQATYCLRVDCPTHSFVAGDFINHNTEIRLSPYGELMLNGVSNNVVPMIENYDGEHMEPTVLPSKIPNMIINGSSGIAVAMSTNMPPHNLNETINAIALLLKNPNADTDEILKVMPGPDFPLGGIIRELDGIKEYFETGKGRFAVESKWSYERVGRHNNIYFTEIPYGVIKSKIVEKIASLIDSEAYPGLLSVEDESNIQGIKIVVRAAEDVDIENLVQFLFKKTQLSSNFSVINLALNEQGKPKLYSMKALLETYIKHQKSVYSEDARNNIKSLDKSIKIAKALIKASSQIKKVVAIIESSKDTETVRKKLRELLDVDDESVTYILDLQLRRIQKIEKKKQEEDLETLEKQREEYQKRLDDEEHLNNVIISDLKKISKTMGDKRRTVITNAEIRAEEKSSTFKILYNDNKIYVHPDDYKISKDDVLENKGAIKTDTGSTTLIIKKNGEASWINNYTLTDKEKDIDNIACLVSLNYDLIDKNLYIFTKNGIAKASPVELVLDTISKKETFDIIGVDEGDEVVAAFIDTEEGSVIAYNSGDRFIRSGLSDIRPMGLTAKGVVLMKLNKDSFILDANSSTNKENIYYINKGKIKSASMETINIQGRAGQGRKMFTNDAVIPGNNDKDIYTAEEKILILK